MAEPSPDKVSGKNHGLPVEVCVVFAIQIAIVTGLVQLDRVVSLGGALNALVGGIFIFLPVLVLDRRGKPYRRYGLAIGAPAVDLLWVLILAVVFFIPLIFAAPWFWSHFWNIGEWNLAWPEGYPVAVLTHLVVVALPEEYFYRGYLMGRLDDIFKGRVSVGGAMLGWGFLIQAVLFALGHFLVDGNPWHLGKFFPALAFGWLRAKRGTIVAPVLFHAACNVFIEILTNGYGFN
jgi:membrane protease YdiL (CAAX protease family)